MSKNTSKICTIEYVCTEGSFPFEDLNSSHGTFVNGKKIPVEGQDPNAEVWNAFEVKTEDIVRFASSRKLCTSGEVQAPIEGRLTVSIASVEKKEKIVPDGKTEPQVEMTLPCTPFDGYQQEKPEVQKPQARKSTSPKTTPGKCDRKWSLLQPAETGQRGTVTDPIETISNGSQTDTSKQADGTLHSYYGQWRETEREFSVYRRQTLKIIVLCLAIAVFYHLFANGLEMMLKANSKRRFTI
ncbi:hypothetical protein ZHAS_00000093 [Anopheles sinensis]|uniref:FHA domain-containing protein n=1 Tax=Anopheles sinensis TaxID=74873 RepID=A0A084V9W1_ANOSI|nr:hypothetical protein ZHAS_00000093 [Anopheles sinensis]